MLNYVYDKNKNEDSFSIKSTNSSIGENGCSICIRSLKDNIKKLNCGHEFHQNCIQQWLNKNNTCPICRQKHNEYNYVKSSIIFQSQNTVLPHLILQSNIRNSSNIQITLPVHYLKTKQFKTYFATFVLLLLLHIGSSFYTNYVTYITNVKIDNLILEKNLTENINFTKKNSAIVIVKTQGILDLVHFVTYIILYISAYKNKICRSEFMVMCIMPIFVTFSIMNIIFHGIYYSNTEDYISDKLLNIDYIYKENLQASFILFILLFIMNEIIGMICFSKMIKIRHEYIRENV